MKLTTINKVVVDGIELYDWELAQLIKYQEEAEKYVSMRMDDSCGTLYEGYEKYVQLKEGLKKLIEQLESVYPVLKNSHFDVHLIDSPSETNLKVRKMLQKILEGKE